MRPVEFRAERTLWALVVLGQYNYKCVAAAAAHCTELYSDASVKRRQRRAKKKAKGEKRRAESEHIGEDRVKEPIGWQAAKNIANDPRK